MAIEQVEFGKNLRPTTVDLVKKVNETITAVNGLNPSEINQLVTDVTNLKQQVSTISENVQTNQTNITSLQNTQQQHTVDIDKVKVTLYTPLTFPDKDPSK